LEFNGLSMPDGLLTTADALIRAGLLPPDRREAANKVAARYSIAVPPAFADLIQTPDDPIGLQVLPHSSELDSAPHERTDPIGDEKYTPVPGIVHRYPDRALLKPLLVCPLYCRFCFRRERVGPDGGLLSDEQIAVALAYIQSTPTIREVILTGGDPLLLSPRRLSFILTALDSISHVELLRLHSRVPAAQPERVTDVLADSLSTQTPLWFVLHANHAREFTPAARSALGRLQARGIPMLGQSVLLRGVNDSEDALEQLFRAMLQVRIKPYYLHQLDPAPGTSRFHVPIEEGQRLLRALRGRVTGLAWPTYVLDIEGGHGKVPIGPTYLHPAGCVTDPWGKLHALAAPAPSR
jgi:lysine 2,3-aminomutase